MSRRAGLILFLLFAAAFVAVNRGAYRGYFQDDALDTLGWAPRLEPLEYLKGALTPRFQTDNFRPVGHFYFHAAGRMFGLDFPKYVLVLHAILLVNVWLIWLLARQLGAKLWAAAAACVFFGFHMALFDAVWKPMYVYDVLCGTFCLLSMLAYGKQRWILSFAAFWLAYKAKEVAVMLPVALACYEYWFGKRRWIPLVPFFLVSVSFGIQGLLLNPNKDNDYTFRFTAAALAKTSIFYAGKIFLLPYLGFVLPLGAFLARNRRTWFGLAVMGIFFLPLLFLPGRLFSAYCYVPFIGLAVAFAGLAEAAHPAVALAFLLLWAPADLAQLRAQRRAKLAADDQAREWVTTAARYAKSAPRTAAVVYSGLPGVMNPWGVEGALHFVFQRGEDLAIAPAGTAQAAKMLAAGRVALFNWDSARRKLEIVTRDPRAGDEPYIEIGEGAPVWQLGSGWYGREGNYCWIARDATARLSRPEGARRFKLRVNVGRELLEKVGAPTVTVELNDLKLEPRRFTEPGWHDVEWELRAGQGGPTRVAIHVDPGYRPAGEERMLGIAVGAFGFR